MPYVKRTVAGRISAVFDRPSRDAKERVRNDDPELLKFLGLAPTQSVPNAAPPAPLEYLTQSSEPDADFPVVTQYYAPPYEEESIYDDASYKPEENTFVEPVADVVNEASEGEQIQTDFSPAGKIWPRKSSSQTCLMTPSIHRDQRRRLRHLKGR